MTPNQPPDELPASGLYQLSIRLDRSLHRRIGSLGRVHLPAGSYIYTGSAKRNLPARIARHRRRDKKLHWHIDYLLTSPHARIHHIDTRPWTGGGECRWNRHTARRTKSSTPVRNFGSSDCQCPGHLLLTRPSAP